jgi:hypothetical protein
VLAFSLHWDSVVVVIEIEADGASWAATGSFVTLFLWTPWNSRGAHLNYHERKLVKSSADTAWVWVYDEESSLHYCGVVCVTHGERVRMSWFVFGVAYDFEVCWQPDGYDG